MDLECQTRSKPQNVSPDADNISPPPHTWWPLKNVKYSLPFFMTET